MFVIGSSSLDVSQQSDGGWAFYTCPLCMYGHHRAPPGTKVYVSKSCISYSNCDAHCINLFSIQIDWMACGRVFVWWNWFSIWIVYNQGTGLNFLGFCFPPPPISHYPLNKFIVAPAARRDITFGNLISIPSVFFFFLLYVCPCMGWVNRSKTLYSVWMRIVDSHCSFLYSNVHIRKCRYIN